MWGRGRLGVRAPFWGGGTRKRFEVFVKLDMEDFSKFTSCASF
jgi:hypothetical protein